MIQRLAFFLLQKNVFTRYLFAIFFFACIFMCLSLIEYQEYESPQYYHTDIGQIHREILVRFHKYKLKSKCKKEFCLKQEMQALINRNPSLATNRKYIYNRQQSQAEGMQRQFDDTESLNNVYALYFSCENFSCYEFIREIESLAPIFILKAQSFNTEVFHEEFLQDSKRESDSTKESTLNDMPLLKGHAGIILDPEDTPKSHPAIQWKQNILLFFEIQNIDVSVFNS